MLSYSDRGLSARVRFYSPFNDITIVVEDINSENFYTKLFKCLLGTQLKVGRVIGIGGKEQVLQRFQQSKDVSQTIAEFYLVDGDFDELIGRALPDDHRLYRLPRYDIESYLVEPYAIAMIAEEQHPRQTSDYYLGQMNFNEWQEN